MFKIWILFGISLSALSCRDVSEPINTCGYSNSLTYCSPLNPSPEFSWAPKYQFENIKNSYPFTLTASNGEHNRRWVFESENSSKQVWALGCLGQCIYQLAIEKDTTRHSVSVSFGQSEDITFVIDVDNESFQYLDSDQKVFTLQVNVTDI